VGKFYPPHKGGMETHLRDLCERLRARYETRVLVANDGARGVEETVGGVRVSRLATPFSVAAAPVCPALAGRIRQSRAALVHLHFPNPTAVLAYLLSGHPGPLVVTYHSDVVRQKFLGRAFLPILHRCLARARAVIATSPDYVESSPVLRRFRERCRVIPLGVETERFRRVGDEEVRRVRERFGERIVLGVGRLIYYKGFTHLVRAMRRVEGRLLLVGHGPLRAALEREARELGVAERVHFLGEVADAVPYFRAADVFALPSVARSEAFGIVQLEAMACGVPVVNTRLDSGVPFVSPDGVTGLTVPPGDDEALADALNQLLDDPPLRARLGEQGRQRVRERFTADVMAEQTMKLYGELIP
jgi:glycosyltransferase involved in cell wall biosynthesis